MAGTGNSAANQGLAPFRDIADLPFAGRVYAEAWQSWSTPRVVRPGETTRQPADERERSIVYRAGVPIAENAIQADGVLAVASPGEPARAWFAPDPAREIATLRLHHRRDRWVLSANGPLDEVQAPNLELALEAVADRLHANRLRSVPGGWSTWSCYFKHVTEQDVLENVEAARRLDLPIEIVQLDDGYEAEVGDWLEARPGFGSVERLAGAVQGAGQKPGIWIAPFMVSPTSGLARNHPDWLVPDATAGEHWGREMRILDITKPGAAAHLRDVFSTFVRWGFALFKLDFLYAAAIPGVDRYRDGMKLIREAVGPDALLLAGGAPLLPSIGLCDAMRIGPDVLPEAADPQLDLDKVVGITNLRRWMNGRLWMNDPDCLVARPQIKDRQAWAAHVMGYGGLRWSSDRLATLDARGLDLTRRLLETKQ